MMCAYIFFLSLCVFLEPLRDNTCSGTLSALSVYERHCKMSLSLSIPFFSRMMCGEKLDRQRHDCKQNTLPRDVSFLPSLLFPATPAACFPLPCRRFASPRVAHTLSRSRSSLYFPPRLFLSFRIEILSFPPAA